LRTRLKNFANFHDIGFPSPLSAKAGVRVR
jgi:hypothetical protein